MKVNDIVPGQPNTTPASTKSVAGTGPSFQSMLAREMEAVNATQTIAPTAGVTAPTAASPSALRIDGLQLTEQTLSTLDQFANALRNPTLSPDDLEPYASALEEDSSALVALKSQLPTGDPLAGVLERAAAVSWLEAAKYRRGDYHA